MHILQDILYKVHLLEVVGVTDIAVSSIAIDSRKVIKGTAFVAIKGVAQDGHDYITKAIELGAKVIVCKIKDNPMAFTSVAYPVDELRLPQWFKDLPFDHAEMEQTIIDNKLDNLIGVLNWDINSTEEKNTFNSLFEF